MKQSAGSETIWIQRRIPFPPERVFEAFTDAARLARWFAPDPTWRVVVHELDPRVGGSYRVDMIPPEGPQHKIRGSYREIERPRLLVFTWQWVDSEEQTVVRVEIQPTKGGSDLTLVHERFSSGESKKSHEEGWDACLARLAGALEG